MSQSTQSPLMENNPGRSAGEAIMDKPVVLFSGQGSQEAGMGRDIADNDREAMDLWKRAEKASGLPLRGIYWDGADEAAMNDTAALQPALTATNFNLWQSFRRRFGAEPAATAGHSLGEFCALAAAGAISPQSAIDITALRGKLMAEADPEGKGAMAAIAKLDETQVLDIVRRASAETGELVVAANFNTPAQTVVSGAKEAVAAVCRLARESKGRGISLKVSGAFHSPMMEEANRELGALLEKTQWKDPAFPVYCGADAKAAKTAESARRNMLRQMVSPVFWVNLIRALYLAGARWWLEISPRAVLGKMVGPSMAGIAGVCDNMRIEVIDSLNSILKYTL